MTPEISSVGIRATATGAELARRWLTELCQRQRLSPTQRRVAQFYLDSMPEGAFLSTVEAAGRAGVSQPTVTRFSAALGFTSYARFQAELRTLLLGEGRPETPDAGHPDPVRSAVTSLESLRGTLDSAAMAEAVTTLAGAHRLAVVGMRLSAALAAYAGYEAARILDDVRVLTDADTVLDALGHLARGDSPVVLVMAMPRYPASTVRALRHARSLGLPTVLVVDHPLVDFAADADHVLVAPVTTDQVFDSHTAPILLVSTLLDRVAGARPRRTQQRLESHESLVHTWAHPGSH